MQNFDRPFLVAITGGIASGKTLVSNWFAEQDFTVYYSDKIAHEVLQQPEVIVRLKELFGDAIICNNEIDRRKLGELVFDDANLLAKLNKIIHPQVYIEIQNIILLSDSDFLVFEIPLLFENGLQNAFDLTINISARNELRLKRIVERDEMTENAASKRIKSQMSEFDKQKLADVNIANEGDIEELFLRLHNLLPLMKKLKKKNVKNISSLWG